MWRLQALRAVTSQPRQRPPTLPMTLRMLFCAGGVARTAKKYVLFGLGPNHSLYTLVCTLFAFFLCTTL